jgi:hypothetical protein
MQLFRPTKNRRKELLPKTKFSFEMHRIHHEESVGATSLSPNISDTPLSINPFFLPMRNPISFPFSGEAKTEAIPP